MQKQKHKLNSVRPLLVDRVWHLAWIAVGTQTSDGVWERPMTRVVGGLPGHVVTRIRKDAYAKQTKQD